MLRLILAFFVVVWLPSAGVLASGPVRTDEADARALAAPESSEGFCFAVLGGRVPGSEAGLKVLGRAVETLNRLGVRFVMTTGNMVAGDTDRARWEKRVEAYRKVMRGLESPWYPTPGPADTAVLGVSRAESEAMYRSAFGPRLYSFDSGWAHVVVLPAERISAGGDSLEGVLGWLSDDLRATRAEQIFVFVHDSLWVGDDAGAWDAVHGVLRADGRLAWVISGALGYARDDGQRDNVRYCSVPVTGAFTRSDHGYASVQSVTLVRVTRGVAEFSVLPFDAVSSISTFPASEAEAVDALLETGWASVEGFVQAGPEPGDGAGFEVALENPTPVRFGFDMEVLSPSGWVFSQRRLSGTIDPGETLRVVVSAEAPALREGHRPAVEVVVTARYPVTGGGEQAVIRHLRVPVRPRGAEAVAGATPGRNGALSLNGRGGVRVDLGEKPWRLTAECWVQSEKIAGSMTLIGRYIDGKGFGLVWSRPGGVLPFGVVGTDRGVARAVLDTPPETGRWHHVAMTYDGHRAVVYLDGVEVGRSEEAGGLLHPDAPLYIGASPDRRGDPVAMFKGLIDEVRVSSVVRYTGTFTPARVFETDENTLLLMHFDRDYYGAEPDDSGRGRHGWVVGGAEIVPAAR